MHKPKTFASLLFVAALIVSCTGGEYPKPDPSCPEAPDTSSTSSSSGGPAAPAPTYGTRLQPHWRTYSDGTKVLDAERLWDSERGEPCSFVRVEGGPARCLPAFVWNTMQPGLFADAACTEPAAAVIACEELPRYVRDDLSKPYQTCEPRPLAELIPLGDPVPDSSLHWLEADGCKPYPGTLAPTNVALRMLAPVPLEMFVEGDEGP